MKASQDLVIWGTGGHARVVADATSLCEGVEVGCFIDDVNPDNVGRCISGIPILGAEGLERAIDQGVRCLIAAIGDNFARVRCAERAQREGFELISIIHPSAVVATGVEIGRGTFVAAGAVINAEARIGENVIVNTKASVGHECEILNGAHICPGVTLGGWVQVHERAWVGLGSTVRDHVTVGRDSLIGVGASVVGDVEEGIVAYGVPARRVRKNRVDEGLPSMAVRD